MGLRKFVLLWCCLLASVAAAQQPQTQTAPIYAANAKWTNGVAPGYAPTKGAGLTLNLGAGTVNCFATIVEYAGGTLSLTNSTTNYVYLDTGSSCAPAFNTSGFTGATIPLAKVVTSGGVISSIDDVRNSFTTPVGTGSIVGGTCTNQAVTALNTAGVPTCTTLTSAYVNNSIALTGTDINTSNQVTVTHLSSALPVNQGGTGTTSTLTGVVRGGSPLTASEISGDCTTSGSNAITCTKINGGTVPTSAKFLQTDGSAKIVSADYADTKIIPAANCPGGTAGSGWSYASGQLTAACRAGTNNLGGILQAIPSTGAIAQFMFELPTDWDTGTQPYINIFYGSGSNTSGTVINTVASACVDNSTPGGASDDPTFHAESAFSTQTMANANRMWNISGQFTAMTSGNGCKATSSVIIKITLSGTASANIGYYKAVITTPRSPVVQGN